MSPAAALALALLAASASGATTFREALNRAEARAASDPERVEFATRAIRAWRPGDGRLMLSHAYLRRAEALLLRREEAAAIEDLTKVMENDAGNRRAVLLRARARLAADRPFEAETDFAAYCAAAPEDPEGWIGLARSRLSAAGVARPPEARKAAARARRLAPQDWRPDWLDGRSYRLEKQPAAALALLDRALSLAKGVSPEPFAERAQARASVGRHAEAKADWSEALALYERAMVVGDRTRAADKAREEDRTRLADAYFARGRLSDFLLETDAARADYGEACELGHAVSCARLKGAARPRPAAKRPAPAPLSAPGEEPRPKPKKRRSSPPTNDAGERIYGG